MVICWQVEATWMVWLSVTQNQILRACGCTLVYVCVLCYRSEETSSHLFLSCDFAVALWAWLGSLLRCDFDLQSPESILSCILSCSSQLWDVFVATIVHMVHVFWLARNVICFGRTNYTLHSAQNSILALVSLSGSLSTSKCIPSDTALLDTFCVPPLFRRYKDIVSIVWKPTTINWIKANKDGSVQNSKAACGGIFRDHRGTFLGCFASNLGLASVFEAELTWLILAMEYVARFHWNRL